MARRLRSQSLLGVLIVLLGIVLLLDTTGVYDAAGVLRFVPSLFVLVGVYALVASRFRNLVGPLVVVVAGAWQLVALGYLRGDQVVDLWPVFVIIFGLSVLLGPLRARARPDDSPHVSAFAVFGGSPKRATGAFRSADLTALFGGCELDLRDADPSERPASVSVTALFGGCEIIVPREWRVEMDVLPLFGGAEDERPRREGEHADTDLVVAGFVAFGGVSVTD